jgi:Beta-lactamase enzyme family
MPDSSGHRFQTMLGGPEVRHILDLTYDTGGWNVAFKTSNLTPAKLKQIHEAQNLAIIAGLPFAERMRLMIRYSDNLAAASCIRDLGFPYIAALMRQIGLFDIPSQRGLWLALNYGDHTWDTHGNLFADVPYITNRRQSCTASAAAAFMTLLFQRRLLADVDANVDMRALLRIDLGGYSSYFHPKTTSADVRQPRRDPETTYYSKVGVVDGFSEVALIERRVSDTLTLRYVLTALNAKFEEDLRELAVEVDKRLVALHGP